MRLLSLEVENYRNIASASLTPGRELTVICGNNGQGKTNLLEAIWLLTGGKSFRGGKDAELVRRGEPFAVLKASTLRAQQEEQEKEEPNRVRLTVGAPDSPRPGRTVSVNGGAVKRAASLAGSFPAVVFDPGHLSLVKGAPEGRRKFLDAALCQLYPGYLTLYRRYVRALQQKNALLRRSSNGIERPYAEKRALLEVLNVELAQQGEALPEGGRASLFLFLADGSTAQPKNGNHRNDHIDREQYTPAQSQRRDRRRRPPHGDIRCQKRSDRLDKLPESQTTRQLIFSNNIREKRVQRGLHQSIPDP